MKTSEVFKRAKAKLQVAKKSEGKERFICYALNRTEASNHDIQMAKNIVRDLLCGCVTLESWLSAKHGVKQNCYTLAGTKKMQATRHAWLDHLIEHYEAKGD